jgi:hypothetical protein
MPPANLATLRRSPSTPTTGRDPWRSVARAGGIMYLLTFVSSIPAVFLLSPVLDNARYILSEGADTRVLIGLLVDLVNPLACVGSAVALYPVLRRINESFAIGFVTSRLFEAAIIIVGILALLSVVTLRQDLGGPNGDPMLEPIGTTLTSLRNWTFLLGPSLMASINALFLATSLHRARLIPRVIPLMGLIGAPMLLTSMVIATLRANDVIDAVHGIAVAPIFAWELSLGLWLTFKGFIPGSTEQFDEPATFTTLR